MKIKWECEFDESKIVEERPELLTHPIVQHSPLKTRGALYGGRTEAMHLHYKIGGNETKEYSDVMSLYPYICKYFKFPIDHPIFHEGDTCKNVEACLKMDGLVRCTIVPKSLYHSVLPYRFNKKLLFCLCRSCFSNRERIMPPLQDAESALEGTWVIDELRLVLEKGYKILEIHEIYEYRVMQYNPKTGKGGLFVEYINTFLKLKAETSGYPCWVRTSADEDQYIEMLWQNDKDKLKYNAAKRGLANVCLTFNNRASYI